MRRGSGQMISSSYRSSHGEYSGHPSSSGGRLTATVASVNPANDDEYLYGPKGGRRDDFSYSGSLESTQSYSYGRHDPGYDEGRPPMPGILDDVRGDLTGRRDIYEPDFRAGSRHRSRSPSREGYNQSRPYGDNDERRRGKCFKCGELGHKKDNCPLLTVSQPSLPRPAVHPPAVAEAAAYDRSQYPGKGEPQMKPLEKKNRPAAHELPKIQKKTKEDGGPEDPDAKISRLKMELVKLDIQLKGLQQLLDRTNQKREELAKRFRGQSLHENKEFQDNMKLQMDAKRKLDAAKRDFDFKDTILKKMIQAAENRASANTEQSAAAPTVASSSLTEKRVDIEEPCDDMSNKIEFFDGGDHWCQQCNYFGSTVGDFLKHLQTDGHWAKNPTSFEAPWPVIRRYTNFAPDRSLAVIKGSQFMIPCKGYYCAICKFFCGDFEAAEEHLFCVNHNRTVAKFYISKPEYEQVFNKDRQTAQTKAVAAARKKKREAEEKKIREEEARKKKAEEEKKQREREIREKAELLKRTKEQNEKKRMKEEKRDRERDARKDSKKERRIYFSDDDSSLDSVPEKKMRPEDDSKIKSGCFVSLSYQDQRVARKALEKSSSKIFQNTHTKKLMKLENNEWKEVKKEEEKKIDKPKDTPAPSKPTTVKIGDDDNNDNLSSVTDQLTKDSEKSDKENSSKEKTSQVLVTTSDSLEIDRSVIQSSETHRTKVRAEFSAKEDAYEEILNVLNSCVGSQDAPDNQTPLNKSNAQASPSKTFPVDKVSDNTSKSDEGSKTNPSDSTCTDKPTKSVSSSGMIDSPITTLDLGCLTKSPTYMDQE